MPDIVLARDPDWGGAGLYLDGKLVWDFYDKDPLLQYDKRHGASFDSTNDWEEALTELAVRLGGTFDLQSRHPLTIKVMDTLNQ